MRTTWQNFLVPRRSSRGVTFRDAVRISEHEATRAELRTRLDALTTGLARVPELLAEVSGRAAANRVRDELARACC